MENQTNFRMLPDYHIHTVLCKHAKGNIGGELIPLSTLAENVQKIPKNVNKSKIY